MPAIFVFNGNFNGEMAENDSNMIDLVITHLTQSLGSPLDLGNPWRPLVTLGDMLENDQFPPKW